MKKYFVIAEIWDEERGKKVKYIAGEFSQKLNANIFRWAYNECHKTRAKVVEDCDLLN